MQVPSPRGVRGDRLTAPSNARRRLSARFRPRRSRPWHRPVDSDRLHGSKTEGPIRGRLHGSKTEGPIREVYVRSRIAWVLSSQFRWRHMGAEVQGEERRLVEEMEPAASAWCAVGWLWVRARGSGHRKIRAGYSDIYSAVAHRTRFSGSDLCVSPLFLYLMRTRLLFTMRYNELLNKAAVALAACASQMPRLGASAPGHGTGGRGPSV